MKPASLELVSLKVQQDMTLCFWKIAHLCCSALRVEVLESGNPQDQEMCEDLLQALRAHGSNSLRASFLSSTTFANHSHGENAF